METKCEVCYTIENLSLSIEMKDKICYMVGGTLCLFSDVVFLIL